MKRVCRRVWVGYNMKCLFFTLHILLLGLDYTHGGFFLCDNLSDGVSDFVADSVFDDRLFRVTIPT